MSDALALCPRCPAVTLEPTRYLSATVDLCSGCSGMWLDSNELASLVGSWRDLPPSVDELFGSPAEPGQLCPRCVQPLVRRAYSDQRRTTIDVCPACHGVWLDRGELDEILREIYGGP